MYQIENNAGRVIANDTQKSVKAVDQALMSLAHLCASIVEVSDASQLPITAAQSALDNVGASLTGIISTRSSVGEATRDLLKLKRQSTLETVAVGCPPDYKATGHISAPATAEA